MAYVINPNGKDVWLRDNADTMDISPATDASSVYLSNGRSVEQELSGTLKSEVVTVDSAMEKIVDGTLDGAYQECVLKGNTKWVDVDSGEILDKFIEGRNLELRGVESPSVTNTTESMPIMDGLICWLDARDLKVGDSIWKDRSKNKNDAILKTISQNLSYSLENNYYRTHTTEYVELQSFNFNSSDGMTIFIDYKLNGNPNAQYQRLVTIGYGDNFSQQIAINDGQSETGYIRCFSVNGWGEQAVFNGNDYGKRLITSISVNTTLNAYTNGIKKTIINNVNFDEIFSVNYLNAESENYVFPRDTSYGSLLIYNRALAEEEIQHIYLYEQSIDRESNTLLTSSQQQNTLTTPQDMTLHKVNNVCDTYNAITGEYIQYIGERVYQAGDETNANVITDMTKTLYILDNPITTIVEPNIVPFAYENGSVSLDSANGILPTLGYATTISRMGQVTSNGLIIRKQEQQITNLEKMLIQGIVNMNYNNALLNLELKL